MNFLSSFDLVLIAHLVLNYMTLKALILDFIISLFPLIPLDNHEEYHLHDFQNYQLDVLSTTTWTKLVLNLKTNWIWTRHKSTHYHLTPPSNRRSSPHPLSPSFPQDFLPTSPSPHHASYICPYSKISIISNLLHHPSPCYKYQASPLLLPLQSSAETRRRENIVLLSTFFFKHFMFLGNFKV